MTHEPHIAQEADTVSVSWLARIALVALAVLIGAVLVPLLFAPLEQPATAASQPRQAPTHIGMLEQSSFGGQGRGQRLQQRQRERLEHYGWVDRNAGVAHIPIEAAMALSLERNR